MSKLYPTNSQQVYYHLIAAIGKFFMLSPSDFHEVITALESEAKIGDLDDDLAFTQALIEALKARAELSAKDLLPEEGAKTGRISSSIPNSEEV